MHTKWNLKVMASWGEGGNLMKPPEFFVVMSIFLKWMGSKFIRGGRGAGEEGETKSNNHKIKVWRYLKVLISKFCTARHLILIFIKRVLPPLRTVWTLQGVSHFSNKCYSTVYTKSALDFVGEFFQKNDIGECGDKKFNGENLPWMMPCKCG